jgi:hypothetical protein
MLLDEIEEDYELFELCNKNNEIQNSILFDVITFKLRSLVSDQGYLMTKFLRDLSKSKGVKKGEEQYRLATGEGEGAETQQDMIDKEKELEDKIEYFNDEVVNKYKEKYGKEPSQEYLKEAKQKIDEQIADQDYYNETDLEGSDLKSNEIMDQGGDYGELNPDDFESGEGFIYEQEEQ